jgi:ribosomal protein S18 acetylase RimI-like enzyme
MIIKYAYDEEENMRDLFNEYTAMLISEDPDVKKILKNQDYANELQHLNEKYSLPYGRLYIAKLDNVPAGCICLRKIDGAGCEIKRLYVRPQFRGHSLAKQLLNKVINDAKNIGYSYILLDTLPFLYGAIHLYKTAGFYEVSAYNNNPDNTAIFMRLDL